MGSYRKKPVVVEARQFALSTDATPIADWCGGRVLYTATPCVLIGTLEGDMRAVVGDYVIKGVAGEFYPCRADIFQATYEAVPEVTS
jgi:hypothetical protein